MRFIVYGAGAVGGVVGARLFQHDHEVVLIARGPHRDAIAAHGLRLQSADEDVTLPIPVVGAPAEIDFRGDDVVLLGVKSQDTVGAALDLGAAAGAECRSCRCRTASPTNPRCCAGSRTCTGSA